MSIIKELEEALAGACDQMTTEAREEDPTGPAQADAERTDPLVAPRPRPS